MNLRMLLTKLGLGQTASLNSSFTNQNKQYRDFEIGNWTYGSPIVLKWNDETTLKIGKFCSIAKNVHILLGGEHFTDQVTTYPIDRFLGGEQHKLQEPRTKGNVSIGNDVWMGTGVIVLSGVSIGDGAVVGAGSVVTRNIPPYVIAAGNPAKQIRKRFSDDVIQALLVIKWWDWPIEQIKEAMPLLMSDNLNDFLAKYAMKESLMRGESGCTSHNPGDNHSAA